MCDPVTATMAGLTIASTLLAHEEGVKAAENQSEALSKAEDMRQADLSRQMDQQNAAAADEMHTAHKAALANMATLDTLSGEYGGGNTASRERSVLQLQQEEDLATVNANNRNALAEIGQSSIASRQGTLSQIKAIKAPSQLGTMLQIGSQAAGAYNQSQQQSKLDKLAAQGKT
ncbi:virion core protein, T7 gp14 family [Aquabacterium sp.]|uniref:virion core protein, T7 gp14 family n=1 Tax=Aquabacterium sp. TaxID=1872578 RepID=UPI0040382297